MDAQPKIGGFGCSKAFASIFFRVSVFVAKKHGRVVDLRIKNMVRVSMASLPVGQGSKEPARGGVLGVSSATSFFLNSPYC